MFKNMVMMACCAVAMAVVASAAQAASFDCAKASHPLEKLICANPALSKLDDEVNKAYKERLELLFDKRAFKGQQKDWMRILRTGCQSQCLAQQVEEEYRQQLANLKSFEEESFTANYKTADEALLTITQHKPQSFAFRLMRYNLDDGSQTYCKLPAKDSMDIKPSDLPVALRQGRNKAVWVGRDGCSIAFDFSWDKESGDITVQTNATGCEKYCTHHYTLSDHFISNNNWVAGNQ
jgi:uncharacterized protein